jgi:hypothetical protein
MQCPGIYYDHKTVKFLGGVVLSALREIATI